MKKSNTEIAAEAFGTDWAEQSDAVRGEWEEFVAAYRDGSSDVNDKRADAVKRALGIKGVALKSGTDAHTPVSPPPVATPNKKVASGILPKLKSAAKGKKS